MSVHDGTSSANRCLFSQIKQVVIQMQALGLGYSKTKISTLIPWNNALQTIWCDNKENYEYIQFECIYVRVGMCGQKLITNDA